MRSRYPFKIILLLLCVSFSFLASASNGQRQKVIDFEDDVVEGMNKRPLDSLSQISDADKKRRKPHLYRKRVGFRSETSETLRVLGYAP